MTRNLTWSLLLILTIIAIILILWHKWPWLMSKEQTKEGFDLDLCFTVDSQSGETVFGPCPESKEQPVSITPEEASFSSGISASSAMGDDSLASSTVTGLGTRDTNEGVGGLTGSGGGALWEQRRGEAAGGSNISSGNFCEDDEFTVGDTCCPKNRLPPGAVYDMNATACEDWSCPRGFIKGAGGMQCVRAGMMSIAVIKGTTPSLDTKGFSKNGTAIGEKDITVRVDAGEPSELGQAEVIIENEESGKQITKPGTKRSHKVFDFGPFDLELVGSGEIKVLVPFSAIMPRAKMSESMTFFYCNPKNHYMSIDGDKQCLPRIDCTGFLAPVEDESYSQCKPFTECEGAPLKYKKGSELDGVTLEDNVCCPPQEDGFTYDASEANAIDPSCNQTCLTGAITKDGCLSEQALTDIECGKGKSKASLVEGKRYFDSSEDQWVVTIGGSGASCVNCSNLLPLNAEWGDNCETKCKNGYFKNNQGLCQEYTVKTSAGNSCPTDASGNKRVKKVGEDYICCNQLSGSEEWANNTLIKAEDLGPGFTTNCNTKCDDGYFKNKNGQCEEYSVNRGDNCEIFTYNGKEYTRVKSDGYPNYKCCSKESDQKWRYDANEVMTTGWKNILSNVKLFVGDSNITGVEKRGSGNNDICGVECGNGYFNSSNDINNPSCQSYSESITRCPVWDDTSTPKLYRTKRGSKSEDLECCSKPNNSDWKYNRNNVTNTYQGQYNSDEGKPVKFNYESSTYSPCTYKCNAGFYSDGGECKSSLDSSNCKMQKQSGAGTEEENPIRTFYTGWNRLPLFPENQPVQCCDPLSKTERWYFSNQAVANPNKTDDNVPFITKGRESECKKVGFTSCWGKYVGYDASIGDVVRGETLKEAKKACMDNDDCGGLQVWGQPSVLAGKNGEETKIVYRKMSNNDNKRYTGCGCHNIYYNENPPNSEGYNWSTIFKEKTFGEQGCRNVN